MQIIPDRCLQAGKSELHCQAIVYLLLSEMEKSQLSGDASLYLRIGERNGTQIELPTCESLPPSAFQPRKILRYCQTISTGICMFWSSGIEKF
jgi:hypothetical protein